MITLIHGDHIEASRKELIRLREKFAGREVRELNGKKLDQTELTQALQSSSILSDSLLVIIEDLLTTLGRKTKQADGIFTILKTASESVEIILWEGKSIPKTVKAALGSWVAESEFPIPVMIFKFLDAIKPNNSRELIQMYTQLRRTEAAELVHAMMLRRFRQLIMLADAVNPPGIQSWQAGRLTTQANFFTIEELKSHYMKLIEMDFAIKSGKAVLPIGDVLELYLVEI